MICHPLPDRADSDAGQPAGYAGPDRRQNPERRLYERRGLAERARIVLDPPAPRTPEEAARAALEAEVVRLQVALQQGRDRDHRAALLLEEARSALKRAGLGEHPVVSRLGAWLNA